MNKILVMKVVGYACSICGLILTGIAGEMDNKIHLEKLVNKNIGDVVKNNIAK